MSSNHISSDQIAKKAHYLFIVLAGFFVVNALTAELIGGKIFSLEATLGFNALKMSLFGKENLGFSLTAGVMLWPVVFIMTDVINEYFGQKGVKKLSYLTVLLLIYAFIMIFAAMKLSPDQWWQFQSGLSDNPSESIIDRDLAFNNVFGQGLSIIVASLIAFLVGQILDAYVFHRIRRWTGEGKLWLRATGSTVISQFVDSFLVVFIAFYLIADWDFARVMAICLVGYSYKFIVAVVLTPFLYLIHKLIDSYLGEELAGKLKSQASQQ